MTDKKDKTALFTGIAAAIVSGFFATINLSIKTSTPWISVILYSITLIAVVLVFFLTRALWLPKSSRRLKIDEILQLYEEISIRLFKTIKERQSKAIDIVFFRLNRKLLNCFKSAYSRYRAENNMAEENNLEASEPVTGYNELLENISTTNKLFLLEMVIDQNHIDQLTVDQFEEYKKEKLSLLQTNAQNYRNRYYTTGMFIIPLEELIEYSGKEMAEICNEEYHYLFNKFREISINETHVIRTKENEIHSILKTI